MMSDLTSLGMLIIFVVGYACIALEHTLGINKAATAIGMAAVLWALLLGHTHDAHHAVEALTEHLAETAQVIFFLMGAMTLVEVIDAHGAFRVVTDQIRTKNPRGLLVAIGFLAFFMSAVLDNLTTTIVMVSLLRRMIADKEQRLLFCSFVVIAANAGGAWTPIGDVTTTMLWIGGQITTVGVIRALLVPSLVSLAASMVMLAFMMTTEPVEAPGAHAEASESMRKGARRVLSLGLSAFLLVPILKATLHVPPFLGICVGLSVMWTFTDVLHREDDSKDPVHVPHALSRIDVSSAFFFLGILLAVGALQTEGILREVASGLAAVTDNEAVIAGLMGVASSIVDNVPLVAAIMQMYPLSQYPIDASFWDLIAYCAGTGGSLLIVGSAAGVALMGMEHVTFGWYMKKASPVAAAGYIAGLLAAIVVG